MRNLLLMVVVFAAFLFTACDQQEILSLENDRSIEARIGALGTYEILAGQTIPVGITSVCLSPDGLNLEVTVDMTSSSWVAGTTHIYVGTFEGIPTGNKGNPKNGHFPYGQEADIGDILANYSTYPQTMTYSIPLADLEFDLDPTTSGDCLTLLVHIEAFNIELVGDPSTSDPSVPTVVGDETGWASGIPMNPDGKGNWSMYNQFCF